MKIQSDWDDYVQPISVLYPNSAETAWGTTTKMVPIQMILQSTLKEAQHNLSKILKSSSNIQII